MHPFLLKSPFRKKHLPPHRACFMTNLMSTSLNKFDPLFVSGLMPVGGRELAALLNLYDERATLECDCERFSLAVSRGWLELHESGTFVKLTQNGAAYFA